MAQVRWSEGSQSGLFNAGGAQHLPGGSSRARRDEGPRGRAVRPRGGGAQAAKVRELMALTERRGGADVGVDDAPVRADVESPPEFMEKFREVARREPIVDLLVPVYMKHFSEEDLDAASRFHESPAGKRFLAAQPLVMREAEEVGERWGVRLAEETLRELAEEARQPQPARHEGQQL